MQSLIPIVRNAGEGDKQSFFGGGLHTWKLLAEDTDGSFFLFEDTMVKDKTTPLHLHPEAHEMTYVIDGEIEVQADGHRSRVRSGGMSFVPKGVAHAFIVVSAEARLITIQSPGAVGQAFYRGASTPAVDGTADRLDLDRLRACAAENPRGIKLLGPPPFAQSDELPRSGAPLARR
jgi:quercetin dioxygenase-like cupin family protein